MGEILKEKVGANSGFVISDEGYRSRDEEQVDSTGGELAPGTILGQRASDGIFVKRNPGATDGSETAAGILEFRIEADKQDRRTVVKRAAEVHGAQLFYEDGANADAIETANDELAELGLIVRR